MSMFYWYGITSLWCALTFICHIFLYRYFLHHKISVSYSYLILVGCFVGFGGVLWLLYIFSLPHEDVYPLSSILFYIGIIAFYFIYLQSALLGEESPSGKIMDFISTHPNTTKEKITRIFEGSTLTESRLEQLLDGGFIRNQKARYIITYKGAKIVWFFEVFKKIFGLTDGG